MTYDKLTLEEIENIKERCKKSNTGTFDRGVTLYKCPCCQKDFSVMYVDGWAYKRKTRSFRKNESVLYFCSYSCTRVYDQIFQK